MFPALFCWRHVAHWCEELQVEPPEQSELLRHCTQELLLRHFGVPPEHPLLEVLLRHCTQPPEWHHCPVELEQLVVSCTPSIGLP
jgi:hypothetical protein